MRNKSKYRSQRCKPRASPRAILKIYRISSPALHQDSWEWELKSCRSWLPSLFESADLAKSAGSPKHALNSALRYHLAVVVFILLNFSKFMTSFVSHFVACQRLLVQFVVVIIDLVLLIQGRCRPDSVVCVKVGHLLGRYRCTRWTPRDRQDCLRGL